MTTSRMFAIYHGRGCLWELARYLRAGCDPDDIASLVADVFTVLELAPAEEMRGGTS